MIQKYVSKECKTSAAGRTNKYLKAPVQFIGKFIKLKEYPIPSTIHIRGSNDPYISSRSSGG